MMVNQSEADAVLGLLESSYREVLDATKHQDDKIGRMLTAIAFLTAASLALANLARGAVLSQRFHTAPVTAPLGGIALVIFLILVLASVVLLISSLATPLRIPGFELRRDQRGADKDQPPPREASRDDQDLASQIYFLSIAGLSLDEWFRRWEFPSPDLHAQRSRTYIRETHNLAERTNFKYSRTTEAVAIFTLALFYLGFATIVVFFAATTHERIVELTPLSRIILALYVSGFAFIAIFTRFRYEWQSVTVVRAKRAIIFAIALPLALGSLILPQGGYATAWELAGFIVLILICFACAVGSVSTAQRLAAGVGVVLFICAGVWAVKTTNYAAQLIIVAIGVSATVIPSLVGPTLQSLQNTRQWKLRGQR